MWNVSDHRDTFGGADQVGNLVVFDIGGNQCRLIAQIYYYKNEHYPIHSISGVSMRRYLIAPKGVARAKVATESGIAESTLSEILASKRKLGIRHVTVLARYFKLDPGLFIPI